MCVWEGGGAQRPHTYEYAGGGGLRAPAPFSYALVTYLFLGPIEGLKHLWGWGPRIPYASYKYTIGPNYASKRYYSTEFITSTTFV